jgi:SAM-dependent methyltransferase
MAKEYPNSKFYGFDNHEASIEAATQLAQKEGVADRVEFTVVSANGSIDKDFDLVAFFDCLHDMADPVGALKSAKQSLKNDGTCMIVEPMANDQIEDNLNLVGKMYYAASSIICVPNSLADNGIALGAQAGEKKTKEIVEKAGFTKFKRATQTPFNIVYEAKP